MAAHRVGEKLISGEAVPAQGAAWGTAARHEQPWYAGSAGV